MAAHISDSDICHHQVILKLFFIYASFFLAALFAGFADSSVSGATFFEAVFFNLVFIDFLLLELPNDPFAIFPFLDFLSPLPMH